MDNYQFISRLLSYGAIQIDRDFELSEGRVSPYLVNLGALNRGHGTKMIGEKYAEIFAEKIWRGVLYGIPHKGVPLAIAASVELANMGKDVPWFFTRDKPKEHGEMTNLPVEERRRKMIVGYTPNPEDSIVMVDDVLTTLELMLGTLIVPLQELGL